MRRKGMKWALFTITAFLLSGCGLFSEDQVALDPEEPADQTEEAPAEELEESPKEDEKEEPSSAEVNQDLSVWLPRLNHVQYIYEGMGNEYAAFTWYPQFNQEDYYQVATNNGGTILVDIYEYRDDEIVRTFRYPEAYFRDNFTEIGTFLENQEEEIILKAPLEMGASWTSGGADYEITAINYKIEVPAGTYETIEVTTTLEDGSTLKRYFAENVGMVSEITETEGNRVASNLEAVEEDATEQIPFTVYVPDEQAMGMETVDAELKLKTNDPARLSIQALLSGQDSNYPEVNILPEGTQIQYLFLNDNQIVEVDVSEEFVTNMNAGSTGELFFIYTLVNTLSQYYGTDEVLLTINGAPYEGAHMILEEGQTLQFNQEMVNE